HDSKSITGTMYAQDCKGTEFHLLIREDVRWWPDRTIAEKTVEADAFDEELLLTGRCRRSWPKVYMEVRWDKPNASWWQNLSFNDYYKVHSPRVTLNCLPHA